MKITKSQLKQLIKEELDSVLSENTKPTTRTHMGLTPEVIRQLKNIVVELEVALTSRFPDPPVGSIIHDLETQLEALKGAYTPDKKPDRVGSLSRTKEFYDDRARYASTPGYKK